MLLPTNTAWRRARLVLTAALAAATAQAASLDAKHVLEATGVKGGVVVHVGCGDGKLTAALRVNDRYLVHGLDTEAKNVRAARATILAAGVGGAVSADRFDGKNLPYVDDLVNLVVSEDLGDVPMAEVLRVLCPNGVAYCQGKKTVKPWPKQMDEWTHYMHDPAGSCVSRDTLVGPPRRLRWVGGPRHARSHEHTASLHALVSANGRLFDVTDLGSRASIQLPSKYTVTARDGFNGTILWRRQIPDWFNHMFPLKSGPAYMPRRLVAVGETVYVSGGIGHKLLALDAATGKTLREYDATATTVDLVVSGGVIFAVVDADRKLFDYNQQNDNCWAEQGRASRRWAWKGQKDRLKAIAAESGKVLWEQELAVAPMTLAADDQKVCFYDGRAVVALDRANGQRLWTSEPVAGAAARRRKPRKGQPAPRPQGLATFGTGYGPKLILHAACVLYSPFGRLVALDPKTGKTRWSVRKAQRSGHFSPEDLYVIDGIAWAAGTARGRGSTFGGYDLATGEQVKNYPNPIKASYMHQRCYPGRATEKWLIAAATGTEFVDPKTGTWEIHHWVRGGCVYGMMPANGLLYATPQACACYYQSKLNGFNALAAGERRLPDKPPARLERGPAYGQARQPQPAAGNPGDWPTFRHDNTRSGFARTAVPADLKRSWSARLGGRVSQAVVAAGRLFVSAIDEHTIHALDAKSGKAVWSYTAGGRVDSPPTIYRGMAVFGCADGHVYALRASDGALAWRFRAAPIDQRLTSYGQLESVWPVHGSVLIHDGVLYVVAGRCMFLDGGLRMVRLKPFTGELISENVMNDKIPGTNDNLQTIMQGKHLPVTLPDILSCDGKFVYMKSQTFTLEGKRARVAPQRPNVQEGEERHLFAPISFLDDSWFHRAYWIYGRAAGEGWAEWQIPGKNAPYGRILAFDDDNVYGYARDPQYLCNSSLLEYRLYSAKKAVNQGQTVRPSVTWRALAKQPEPKLTRLAFNWKTGHPPVMVRAMVLANDTLFVAGPPDVADEHALWGRSNEDVFRTKMTEQAEALEGSQGAMLWAVSKKDGKKLSELKLKALPAFDGMIAADARLFLTTANGSVLCFEGR